MRRGDHEGRRTDRLDILNKVEPVKVKTSYRFSNSAYICQLMLPSYNWLNHPVLYVRCFFVLEVINSWYVCSSLSLSQRRMLCDFWGPFVPRIMHYRCWISLTYRAFHTGSNMCCVDLQKLSKQSKICVKLALTHNCLQPHVAYTRSIRHTNVHFNSVQLYLYTGKIITTAASRRFIL